MAAEITTTASFVVPGDSLLGHEAELLRVLWREKALDGRIHIVMAKPDGSRVCRTLLSGTAVRVIPEFPASIEGAR